MVSETTSGLVVASGPPVLLASTSSPRTSAFPSLRLTPSPRLLLSPSSLAMTLMPPALVIRSPPVALVLSCSPSPGPLAVTGSPPHVGGSPTPSRSPSPSTEAEANDEADILGEADTMANILAKAKSDGSLGYVTMDLEDDHLHGYATPVLLGQNIFLRISPYGSLVCFICPNCKARGWIKADARAHVLARAHAP